MSCKLTGHKIRKLYIDQMLTDSVVSYYLYVVDICYLHKKNRI